MTDLFGNIVPPDSPEEIHLREYDEGSFDERLKRLKYVNQYIPQGNRLFGSTESYKIFNESTHCFIFGQYTATVVLSLSFIERRFQEYYHLRMDKRAKYTLDQLLKDAKDQEFLDLYLIDKINTLRLKRNPFIHYRDPNDLQSFQNRAMHIDTHPDDLLETDAKDAITLMFAISQYKVI